jgi:hypothetical protein
MRAAVDLTRVELRWRHLRELEGVTPLEYCMAVHKLSFSRRDLHTTVYLSEGILQSRTPPQSRTPSPFPVYHAPAQDVQEEKAEALWSYADENPVARQLRESPAWTVAAPPRPPTGDALLEFDGEDVVVRVEGLTSNAYYEAEVFVRYRGIAAWEPRPALSAAFRAGSALEHAQLEVRVVGPNGLPERREVPVEGNHRVAVNCRARENARNPLQRAPRTPRELASVAQEAEGPEVVSLLKEGIAGMKQLFEGKRPVAPPLPKLRGNYPRSR